MEPNYDYEEEAPRHRQRPPSDDRPPQHQQHPQQHQHASNADLVNSAKYLAEAARSAFSHESGKVDTGRAAGAAADLLDAASHYARLEEKSFGKYVDQAENYLHQYQSSHSTTSVGSNHAPTSAGAAPQHSFPSSHAPPKKDDEEDSGGGYGDYIKMAQGFLKKY
ncbi:hypothetical protein MLD38_005351 [Melastoma candidum]|uniref:Uncharacterized protein n=1 Tax=Melastoma candidum TaxID=119954 RepID=A0ACB9S8P3_9MYRT|nr:hypothetical protein MLD38_005351 [Melastoma candidum]